MTNRSSITHSGGVAAWSIRHPVGVTMIAMAVVVLGLFSLSRLSVDLLPHLIYPDIRVRILDPGVPPGVMEDQVTRQLEEQLAITENAIGVQSTTTEGASSVDLSFPYGSDIDLALRDASTRLDRAKRFLPDSIDPPIIYKRDPSQIPVLEFVVSSDSRDGIALREWVDYRFSKLFINLPGVAAVEVGGGREREIQVLPDPDALAGVGLTVNDIVAALADENVDVPAGRVIMSQREMSSRTSGRFESVDDIRNLPIPLAGGDQIKLDDVATIHDTHADERIRVRLNGIAGVKVSIQKQPKANTVAVADAVNERVTQLTESGQIPADIQLRPVADQSVHVRQSLNNASLAALSGALLAMLVVYLFLGNLRRTLIIGSAIPLAIMVTFILMGGAGLTFNIMTLGGLALGVGLLVDNTIVMLENIHRHQKAGEANEDAGENAAREINGAIVAATSTNLAAVLPFLFIGGLTGLLFRELIFTISAAILASMVVALTLVPAWGVRVRTLGSGALRRTVDRIVVGLQQRYAGFVAWLLQQRLLQTGFIVLLIALLVSSLPLFISAKQEFLPSMDTGEVNIYLTTDPGTALEVMDSAVHQVEEALLSMPEVDTVFSTVGGFIFGRTQRELSNRTSINVQLVPQAERTVSSSEWIRLAKKHLAQVAPTGVTIRMRERGIRGIRLGRSDDDVGIRIQGPDLDTLAQLGDQVSRELHNIKGLGNIQHSAEERTMELSLKLDRPRATQLGITADDVGATLRTALNGTIATRYLSNDRSFDVRVRLPRNAVDDISEIAQLHIYSSRAQQPVRVEDVASIELVDSPSEIRRDNQHRIVEVTASIADDAVPGEVYAQVAELMERLPLPPEYTLYDAGGLETLQEGQQTGQLLLALALFLVYVVMAVQYESLRNPFIILLAVPFAAIGVAAGLLLLELPISMPVWLGMIMLAGIVVNNAIVLVSYIEQAREQGEARDEAIIEGARLRLRPILMTTLTTVVGMLPLAIGVGEGSEMLQPLAIALISGLLASLLVTLVFIPIVYRWFHPVIAGEES